MLNGTDLVIDDGLGDGIDAFVRALAARARREGVEVVHFGAPTAAPAQRRATVVTVDDRTAASVTRIRTMSGGRTVLIAVRPWVRTCTTEDRELRAALHEPATITLRPLDLDGVNDLIDELVAERRLASDFSRLERAWVQVASGGIRSLALILAQEMDTHHAGAEPEPPLDRFSRRALAAATEVLAALPDSLRRTAQELEPLTGTTLSRLAAFFPSTELGYLADAGLIAECDGTLVMSPLIRSALRLAADPAVPVARRDDVVLDICAAVGSDAVYTEGGLGVAAAALVSTQSVRDAVPQELGRRVLYRAAWLARRRGDLGYAAVLARRLAPVDLADTAAFAGAMVRGESDTELFSAPFELPDAMSPEDVWVWSRCLQLPLTAEPAWAADTLRQVAERTTAAHAPEVRQIAAAVRAAGALDADDGSAADDAAQLLAAPGTTPAALLRASVVRAADAAVRADYAALESVTADVLALEPESRVTIDDALVRRDHLDAVMFVSLARSAAGLMPSDAVRAAADRLAVTAMRLSDHAALARTTLCLLLYARQRADYAERARLIRFLPRLSGADITSWGEAVVTETLPRPLPALYLDAGWWPREALSLTQLLTWHASGTVEDLRAGLVHLRTADGPIATLASAFVAAVHGEAHASVPDIAYPAGSITAAFAAVVRGGADHDPQRILSGAEALLSHGAPRAAQLALNLLADDALSGVSADTVRRAVRVSQARSPAVVQLTGREREVARLASRGLSNRQIADRLFVSVRTVESHIYRALHKLGLRREDLARAVLDGSDGTVPPPWPVEPRAADG